MDKRIAELPTVASAGSRQARRGGLRLARLRRARFIALPVVLLAGLVGGAWGVGGPDCAAAQPADAAQTGSKPATDKPESDKPPADSKPSEGAPADEPPDAPPPDPVEAEEQKALPLLEAMERPSFARLLKGPAVDWIVLKNDKVIECEPIYPRPGALAAVQKRIADSLRRGPALPLSEDAKRKRRKLYYLPVTLLDGEEREFKLHVQYVSLIIYYEDLMLHRADALLDERKLREAFELLLAIEARDVQWPGLKDRQERLLFLEAEHRLEQKQLESSLALFEELHQRNPKYQGISAQLGKVIDDLIARSVLQEDYRQARFFLHRLEKRLGKHPVVVRQSAALQSLAQSAIADGRRSEAAGQWSDALDKVERAARIWPATEELASAYNRIELRYQRLRVGVLELPHARPHPDFRSAADLRERQLTVTQLFQPSRVDGNVVRYGTRSFEDWEPEDLGHRLRVRLKQQTFPWESQPLPTAALIAARLSSRLDPHGPAADERFASYVDSMTIVSPLELVINFRQVPLRPEALFAFPATDLPRGEPVAGRTATGASAAATPPPATYPFQVHLRSAEQVVYRRTVPEPAGSLDRHVTEVIEVLYPSHEAALQGLFRGEISLLPRVPASVAPRLDGRGDFFSYAYATPVTHILQFNPRTEALANRTFRRALAYALNRPKLLDDVFLKGAPARLGRVTSAPFPTTSYAYNRVVEPYRYDVSLAFSLVAAARKELGGKIAPLTLVCPADPEMQDAAKQIVEQWRRVGLEVTLLPPTDAGAPPASWDLLYSSQAMVEPLLELWKCITLTGRTSVNELTKLPVWLRHELLQLDQAEDWNAAQAQLHRLHRQLWAEVYLIPLWELNDVLIARKHVRGIPEHPLGTYDGIERWTIEPWYPRDFATSSGEPRK